MLQYKTEKLENKHGILEPTITNIYIISDRLVRWFFSRNQVRKYQERILYL